MSEIPGNSFEEKTEKNNEKWDLAREIIELRKEIEKAHIEIESVKKLAQERVLHLMEEIETVKNIVFKIVWWMGNAQRNNDVFTDLQKETNTQVSSITRI